MDYRRLQAFYAVYCQAVRPCLEKFQSWVIHRYFYQVGPFGYQARRHKPGNPEALYRELADELINEGQTHVPAEQLPSALRDALASSLEELEYRRQLWETDQRRGVEQRVSLAFLDCQFSLLRKLVDAHYDSVEQINRAADRELTRLPGIKQGWLAQIRQSVIRHLARHPAPASPQPNLFSA